MPLEPIPPAPLPFPQWLHIFLGGFGIGIILSWNLEAWFVGRGFVSAYVGPIGLAAILISWLLGLRWTARKS